MIKYEKENKDMASTMTKFMTKEFEEAELDDNALESVVGGVNVPPVVYVCTSCNKRFYGALNRDIHANNTGHRFFSSEHKNC